MRIRYLIIILIFLLLTFSGVAWYLITSRPVAYTTKVTEESITDVHVAEKPLEETPLLKNETRTEDNPKEKYHISVIYPSIILATQPATANRASDFLKATANHIVESFPL